MPRLSRLALALLLGLLCLSSTQAQVRRSEVIAIADQYVHYKWKPARRTRSRGDAAASLWKRRTALSRAPAFARAGGCPVR